MKAYIGGDETIEAAQRARGFKTYRDAYNKKIQELEHNGKVLRESQKEIKVGERAYFTFFEYILMASSILEPIRAKHETDIHV